MVDEIIQEIDDKLLGEIFMDCGQSMSKKLKVGSFILLILSIIVIAVVIWPLFQEDSKDGFIAANDIPSAITADGTSRVDLSGRFVTLSHRDKNLNFEIKIGGQMLCNYNDNRFFYNCFIKDNTNQLDIHFAFKQDSDDDIGWFTLSYMEITKYIDDGEEMKFFLEKTRNLDFRKSKHYRCHRADQEYVLMAMNARSVGYIRFNHLEYQFNLTRKNDNLRDKFTTEPDPLSCSLDVGTAISEDHKSRLDIHATIRFDTRKPSWYEISTAGSLSGFYNRTIERYEAHFWTLNELVRTKISFLLALKKEGNNFYKLEKAELVVNDFQGGPNYKVKFNYPSKAPPGSHYKCEKSIDYDINNLDDDTKVGTIEIRRLEFENSQDMDLYEGFSDNINPNSC